jgi:hypothetical protein
MISASPPRHTFFFHNPIPFQLAYFHDRLDPLANILMFLRPPNLDMVLEVRIPSVTVILPPSFSRFFNTGPICYVTYCPLRLQKPFGSPVCAPGPQYFPETGLYVPSSSYHATVCKTVYLHDGFDTLDIPLLVPSPPNLDSVPQTPLPSVTVI